MVDGYSVQEAASVLGVAEGRVWELLARGVLLGTPEGDSMRVFLKAQPGPIATAGTPEDSPRTNGNGGSHGPTGEASAFRELLTEFRNLTERYGQALLALGEARGEVAGLRSRVDQLEARLDLRLPPPLDAAPVAWESSTASGPAVEPSPPTPPPAAPPRAPARRRPRPRRAPSPREAVAGFADALARAQDPNAADLGEAPAQVEADAGAGAALASEAAQTTEQPTAEAVDAREDLEAGSVAAEESAVEMPEAEEATDEALATADIAAGEAAAEEPAAEEQPVEIEPPTYSAVVVEPDWFADGDFAWLDAAEMEASGQPEVGATTPESPEPEAPEGAEAAGEPLAAAEEPQAAAEEPQAAAEEPQGAAEGIAPEPEAMQQPEATQEPEVPAAPVAEAQPEPLPQPLPEPLPEFDAEVEFEPWQPPEPPPAEVAAEPQALDALDTPPMATAVPIDDVEEEVMWLGREQEPSPAAADAWPSVDTAPPVMEVARPPLAMTEDELARLALDEGWDDAEVAAIRAMITPPPTSTVDLPGAADLHEAMAALEAVPVRADPAYDDVSRQWAKPAPDDDEPPHDDWAFEPEPAPPLPTASRPPTDVTSALRRTAEDPGWLRRRQGPAAAAYRRLRRLFPG